jgi:hypothetical protein
MILIVLTVFGCKGPVQTSAASASEGAVGGSNGDGGGNGGGTRTENVPDPTMNNITAYSVKVPASWKFQGVLMQGGPATCDSYAMLTWKATSPDGESKMEQLPQMLWVYGNGPKPLHGCLPIKNAMSAQDFLKNLASMMGLVYKSDEPLPDENAKYQQGWRDTDAKGQAFYSSHNLSAPKDTGEVRGAIVESRIGSTAIKGEMKTWVHCTETTRPGFHSILQGMPSTPPAVTGKCTADVVYLSSPESQFASLSRLWNSPEMAAAQNHEWGDAWVKRYAQQGDITTKKLIAQTDAQFAAQRQEIAHTMAVQQQVHDQFLATMQRGTDMSMARAQDSMNARSTAASDMVDYSPDRQTVMDTDTGTIYKVTNQLTPGGPLVKVHGNGTP